MDNKTYLDLTQDLFRLVKRFPHIKLKQSDLSGLPRSEYELLALLRMNLDDENKAISVSEISAMLQITPAGVTHLINPLEEHGLVKRQADPTDRRIVRIGLTAKGTEISDALLADVQAQLIGLINHLGEEDSKTLLRLMWRALEYLAQSEAGKGRS